MKNNLKALMILIMIGQSAIAQEKPSSDLFRGWSQPFSYQQMIVPFGLEISFHKTTHLLFASPIRYVDLGSNNLIAGKAKQAENVLRIKAKKEHFTAETNLTVICEDGSFYTFNVKYADEPEKLNIDMNEAIMKDARKHPNKQTVLFRELAGESPRLVDLIMESIYRNNRTRIHHIGSKKASIQFRLKGLYVEKGLLYFHTALKNRSSVPFEVDFIIFKIVDKKLLKKTAMQEKQLQPVRVYHSLGQIQGKSKEHSVFCLGKITLPNDKLLVVDVFEKNGGRHQTFQLENKDLIQVETIEKLQLRWN
ncbi:conjugative transposon protein TraN [uncultured Polaribacter sp.]|uniref:conjugative transposon protein TraN n=1 Tax=uncultured Polaribacter sp. TaxID=174711 RepID=UPI00260F341B|nr:conjugative transposon protein TraN [uncultured Polaribacter sp.]